MQWTREHPILVLAIPVFFVWVITVALSGNDTSSQSELTCPPSQRVEVNGKFVCQQVPVQPSQSAVTSTVSPTAADWTVVSEEPAPSNPTVSVSGTYAGTVHNQTANLSSTFTVVIHQSKGGLLDGCMKVQPPLYGSGMLRGSIRGTRVRFAVADITFQGDGSKNGITGSYVVTRQDGNQLGDFRLTKQAGGNTSYLCTDGELTKFKVVDAAPSSSDVPPGAQVLPSTANSTVETPTVSAERNGTRNRQPDLSSLTSSERQSIEAACSSAKYNQGPAAYDQCLVRQFDEWRAGPRQPDLSTLSSPERQSIEAACSSAKYNQGPAAYNHCLVRQFEEWTAGPKRPDLSSLNSSERQSIESACSSAKYNQGPAAYNGCLVRQLEALKNYRQ